MIPPKLLQIICCPENHQALAVADPKLIQELNLKIAQGHVRNRAGAIVSERIDEGLVRADQRYLYPIRDSLPILLIDEAIPL
jgi:uncharacterized protein YbaR (Trm112 family)